MKEKVAHLQHIQDYYINPVLSIASSLFSEVAKAKIAIGNGEPNEYDITVLLAEKALGEIKEISEAAIMLLPAKDNL